jgi:putative transposase
VDAENLTALPAWRNADACEGQYREDRQTYEFIKAHRNRFNVRTICPVLEVAPSGYYAWLQEPVCQRALEDVRLLRLIRASYTASPGIYGAPRVFLDLREAGETCSKHRVMRLMRVNKIRAVRGYRVRHSTASKPSDLIPNVLQRKFDVASPNNAWVTDITYIRTWEGGLYLAVVMDLYSRKIVGWSTRSLIFSSRYLLGRARPSKRGRCELSQIKLSVNEVCQRQEHCIADA